MREVTIYKDLFVKEFMIKGEIHSRKFGIPNMQFGGNIVFFNEVFIERINFKRLVDSKDTDQIEVSIKKNYDHRLIQNL